MMNSMPEKEARRILTNLFEQLDEEHLRRKIDEPIYRAAADFRFLPRNSLSHREFVQSVGEFVRHLYSHGFPAGLNLTEEQARAEAIALLEGKYRNSNARGFSAALLDARNPVHNGLELIFTRLSEMIRATQREKYSRWVIGTSLSQCDWSVKCQIVKLLLSLLEPFLPENLLRCHPAQFADNIPDLIATHFQTDTLLHQAKINSEMFPAN